MEENPIYTGDGTIDKKLIVLSGAKLGTGEECCQRLTYYGMITNLVNYLIKRLNQGSAEAANNVTNWSGTCYITPLVGTFVADAYLGRYWVIAIFSSIYVLGMTLLTLAASVNGLKPQRHNDMCHTKQGHIVVFFVALYMVALGTGGIKPCVSSFGADQFDETDQKEKEKKSSFNRFHLSINIGALIASCVGLHTRTCKLGLGFWHSSSNYGSCNCFLLFWYTTVLKSKAWR